MGNIYRLAGLENSDLLAGLASLVQRSQEITAEELAHLAEIEDRMLHLELGFSSLFAYCVEAHGMSEGARFSRVRKRTRYLSAAVRRAVYPRDGRQCSFVSADGRRCGARAFLQLDHVKPWAALGPPVVAKIRVLCRAHNMLHARNCFGAGHLATKIAARRREARASEI